MKLLRVLIVLLLAIAISLVVGRLLIPRLQCNLAKGQINRDARRPRAGEYERAARARQNIATCRQCIATFPYDHQWYTLLGANLRIAGEQKEALASFHHALTLVERPEIYAQIGELEIERGNIAAGHAALLRAAIFQIFYIDFVADPMRSDLQDEVMARYNRLQAQIKHGSANQRRPAATSRKSRS